MAKNIHFGEISGYEAPYEFPTRRAAYEAGIHRSPRSRFSGGKNGVDAVYASNKFEGEFFTSDLVSCIGSGGMAPDGEPTGDQKFTRSNLGLARVQQQALPVRVIAKKSLITGRGSDTGVVYVGLYYVSRWDWVEVENERWLLFQFEAAPGTVERLEKYYAAKGVVPTRTLVTTNRIIRDSAVVREVKRLYKNRCQICGTQLKTAIGTYSEGAHIRPLGRPHDGTDELANILCLCPNCHKQFDGHALVIDSASYEVSELGTPKGKLKVHKNHKIDPMNLDYQMQASMGR